MKTLMNSYVVRDLTHEQSKKLFLQKMLAIEKKDLVFLKNLKEQHPEFFDPQFLYQLLQNDLEKTGKSIPLEINNALLKVLSKTIN